MADGGFKDRLGASERGNTSLEQLLLYHPLPRFILSIPCFLPNAAPPLNVT